MAANALRLRRSLALTSSILNHPRHFTSAIQVVGQPPSSPSTIQQNPSLFDINRSKPNSSLSFHFISSRSISSRARYNNDDMDGDQISPDAILFEGCDYNHWLITMDFPKDPKPSPEEMVEAYVQTAAKVVGSVEEAKKKIYACSTTTYNGFQVEVSEEVSEQFKGLPGVVFVLPDSYIDPVNKEYGGDKYINGTIIPRPPPVQYGRQGGRYNDRNREYNRPPPRGQMEQNNYAPGGDRRGPMPTYQGQGGQGIGNPARPPPVGDNNQGGGGYRQGGGGQFGQGGGGGQFGQGGGAGQFGQGGGGGQFGQGGGGQFGQGGGGGQFGQGGGGGQFGQGGGGGQFGQRGGGGDYGQYGQPGGGNYGQGAGGGNYGQGAGGGNYGQGAGGGNYGQGASGGNYGQGAVGGNYGQGASGGNYGQGAAGGNYGQGAAGGNYGQGAGGGNYGQGAGGGNYVQGAGGGNYGQSAGGGGSYGQQYGGQQGNNQVTEESEAFKER